MALVNLLKSSYSKKLGQTVGARWKDKNTLRTYAKTPSRNTPENNALKANFGLLSQIFGAIKDNLKPFVAVPPEAVSLYHHMMALNAEPMQELTLNWDDVIMTTGTAPFIYNIRYSFSGRDTLRFDWDFNSGSDPTPWNEKVRILGYSMDRKIVFSLYESAYAPGISYIDRNITSDHVHWWFIEYKDVPPFSEIKNSQHVYTQPGR